MKKIVWVDDDINTGVMRAILDEFRDNGVEVETIDNPDKFLEILDRSDYDCLVMDVLMPVGQKMSTDETENGLATGIALLKRFLEKQRKIPVVICTIRNDDVVRLFARDHKIPHVTKQDFNSRELYNHIQEVVDGKKG